MSARRELIRRLSEDSLGGIATLHDVTDAEQLVDAHRAEVIAEHRATFTMADARGIARNHRRAVLQQAIEVAEQVTRAEGGDGLELAQAAQGGAARVTAALRRMVDEVKEKDTREGESTLADVTVYRASHDSIVMGLYTTAAEARKHCETLVRREYDETSKVHLWWREDEDTVDQPEDGEQELYEHLKSVGVTGPGWTHRTGYVVTPLTVASKYDEEADE